MNLLKTKILEPFCIRMTPIKLSDKIYDNVKKIIDDALSRVRQSKKDEIDSIIDELEKEIFNEQM